MNIILFEEEELKHPIAVDDPRIVHMDRVLGIGAGDEFNAGIPGSFRGRALVKTCGPEGWQIGFSALEKPMKPEAVRMIIGCPRPPVARRLLKDLCSMGLREIRFCGSDLSEKSYLQAKLWRKDLWRRAILEGAMQGGSTQIPIVKTVPTLRRALRDLPDAENSLRIAFDVGAEAEQLPGNIYTQEAVIAVGPERGWSDSERRILQESGYTFYSLGERILRTETACSVALGIILYLIRR